MEHYSAGWNIVKENLVGWVIFCAVLMVTMGFGIGLLLLPNAVRAVRDAIQANTAPEIGALFNFDNITDDAIGMIIYAVALFAGSIVVIGGLIVGVLFFWVPPLLAEKRVAGAESWKASLAHAKGNFVDILVFSLIGGLLNSVASMLCFVPMLVTFPITLVAMWLFYQQNRDQVLALARQDGVNLLNG